MEANSNVSAVPLSYRNSYWHCRPACCYTFDKQSDQSLHLFTCCKLINMLFFSPQIEVLPSLQRPKKITMKGSDGRLYVMLCKPKVSKSFKFGICNKNCHMN